MLKKAALAVFGLVLALSLSAPKAQAEVNFGIAIGTPGVYGSVAVLPASHDTYYGSYGYYDNGYYDNAPYGYYDNQYNPYAYGGTYYDSNRYYYRDGYRKHWRHRDDHWRHRHEYRHDKYEREHDRWHEKHDHDRW
jgi:hypothetical protein